MTKKCEFLFILFSFFSVFTGCKEKCQNCPDCAIEEDIYDAVSEEVIEDFQDERDIQFEEVPGECNIPQVVCDSGLHAEYGICVPDSDVITIPSGTFTMGTSGGEDNPLHEVTLSSFEIDRFEITNRKYRACVEAGCCSAPQYDGSYTGREPYYGNPEYDDYPVIFVNWNQAMEYCSGLGKALPTEAQWEKAARGEDGRTYPWGESSPTSTNANFNSPIDGDTDRVGSRPAGDSPYGLSDMAGNVWEWVKDWYSKDYYLNSPANDPEGPENGVAKVARGGGFGSHSQEIRTYYRGSFHPEEAFSNLGFRCVKNQ